MQRGREQELRGSQDNSRREKTYLLSKEIKSKSSHWPLLLEVTEKHTVNHRRAGEMLWDVSKGPGLTKASMVDMRQQYIEKANDEALEIESENVEDMVGTTTEVKDEKGKDKEDIVIIIIITSIYY